MDEASESLLIRQTYLDHSQKTAAIISIRTDTTAVPTPLSVDTIEFGRKRWRFTEMPSVCSLDGANLMKRSCRSGTSRFTGLWQSRTSSTTTGISFADEIMVINLQAYCQAWNHK